MDTLLTGDAWQLRHVGVPATIDKSSLTIRLKEDGEVSVGRGPQADYFLDSNIYVRLVSRVHAVIVGERLPGSHIRFTLVNKGLNGTYINDFKLGVSDNNTQILHDGDKVAFGHINCGSISIGEYAPQPHSEFQFLFERVKRVKDLESLEDPCRTKSFCSPFPSDTPIYSNAENSALPDEEEDEGYHHGSSPRSVDATSEKENEMYKPSCSNHSSFHHKGFSSEDKTSLLKENVKEPPEKCHHQHKPSGTPSDATVTGKKAIKTDSNDSKNSPTKQSLPDVIPHNYVVKVDSPHKQNSTMTKPCSLPGYDDENILSEFAHHEIKREIVGEDEESLCGSADSIDSEKSTKHTALCCDGSNEGLKSWTAIEQRKIGNDENYTSSIKVESVTSLANWTDLDSMQKSYEGMQSSPKLVDAVEDNGNILLEMNKNSKEGKVDKELAKSTYENSSPRSKATPRKGGVTANKMRSKLRSKDTRLQDEGTNSDKLLPAVNRLENPLDDSNSQSLKKGESRSGGKIKIASNAMKEGSRSEILCPLLKHFRDTSPVVLLEKMPDNLEGKLWTHLKIKENLSKVKLQSSNSKPIKIHHLHHHDHKIHVKQSCSLSSIHSHSSLKMLKSPHKLHISQRKRRKSPLGAAVDCTKRTNPPPKCEELDGIGKSSEPGIGKLSAMSECHHDPSVGPASLSSSPSSDKPNIPTTKPHVSFIKNTHSLSSASPSSLLASPLALLSLASPSSSSSSSPSSTSASSSSLPTSAAATNQNHESFHHSAREARLPGSGFHCPKAAPLSGGLYSCDFSSDEEEEEDRTPNTTLSIVKRIYSPSRSKMAEDSADVKQNDVAKSAPPGDKKGSNVDAKKPPCPQAGKEAAGQDRTSSFGVDKACPPPALTKEGPLKPKKSDCSNKESLKASPRPSSETIEKVGGDKKDRPVTSETSSTPQPTSKKAPTPIKSKKTISKEKSSTSKSFKNLSTQPSSSSPSSTSSLSTSTTSSHSSSTPKNNKPPPKKEISVSVGDHSSSSKPTSTSTESLSLPPSKGLASSSSGSASKNEKGIPRKGDSIKDSCTTSPSIIKSLQEKLSSSFLKQKSDASSKKQDSTDFSKDKSNIVSSGKKKNPPVGLSTNKSGGSKLSANKSGGSELSANKSGGSELSANKSGGSKLSANKSVGSELSANKSGGSELSANKLGGSELSANKLGGSKLSANKSGGSELSANKSGGSELSANKSGGSELSANKSGGSELSANKSGHSGPSANKSGGSDLSVNKSSGSGLSANKSSCSGLSTNKSGGSGLSANKSGGPGQNERPVGVPALCESKQKDPLKKKNITKGVASALAPESNSPLAGKASSLKRHISPEDGALPAKKSKISSDITLAMPSSSTSSSSNLSKQVSASKLDASVAKNIRSSDKNSLSKKTHSKSAKDVTIKKAPSNRNPIIELFPLFSPSSSSDSSSQSSSSSPTVLPISKQRKVSKNNDISSKIKSSKDGKSLPDINSTKQSVRDTINTKTKSPALSQSKPTGKSPVVSQSKPTGKSPVISQSKPPGMPQSKTPAKSQSKIPAKPTAKPSTNTQSKPPAISPAKPSTSLRQPSQALSGSQAKDSSVKGGGPSSDVRSNHVKSLRTKSKPTVPQSSTPQDKLKEKNTTLASDSRSSRAQLKSSSQQSSSSRLAPRSEDSRPKRKSAALDLPPSSHNHGKLLRNTTSNPTKSGESKEKAGTKKKTPFSSKWSDSESDDDDDDDDADMTIEEDYGKREASDDLDEDLWDLEEGIQYCDTLCEAKKCRNPVGRKVNWVMCDQCERWYHMVCVNTSSEQVERDGDQFVCGLC